MENKKEFWVVEEGVVLKLIRGFLEIESFFYVSIRKIVGWI